MAANNGKRDKKIDIDPRSGFSISNGIYYSKREPITLPRPHLPLDLTTYVFSSSSHRTSPHAVALIDAPTGRSISFSTLHHNVKCLAAGLHRLGIRKGNVVLVLSPNSIHIPCIYLAVLSLGAILTTSNPLNTDAEIQNQVADSNPVIIFTTRELLLKARVTQLPVILIDIRNEERHGCPYTLHELLQSSSDDAPSVEIRQDDTATLLYSSGTTGKSKGVVSTHRNCIATVAGMGGGGLFDDTEGWVDLLMMPLFHVYGFCYSIRAVAKGATLVVMPKFDLAQMLWSIQRYKVSNVPAAPPIFVALTKSPLVAKYDLSSLRRVGSGGAPLGKEVIDEFIARFPNVEVGQGSGLTESSGAVTFTSGSEGMKKYGTAGLLAANVEAKIVETITGKALPPNQRGELWLRGPIIMKGYFGNEAATASTLDSEGWLKTGDLCYFDEDGFLFVVDRIKELIKYKAFQVAPAELEELLLANPEIADAAVIPYPDKEAGQIPMAFIVRKSASKLREDDVMNFVSKQVAPYKKIRRVAFVSSIPKAPSGKILRKDLIQKALSTSKL